MTVEPRRAADWAPPPSVRTWPRPAALGEPVCVTLRDREDPFGYGAVGVVERVPVRARRPTKTDRAHQWLVRCAPGPEGTIALAWGEWMHLDDFLQDPLTGITDGD